MVLSVTAIDQEGAERTGTREVTREGQEYGQWRDMGIGSKRKRPEKILLIIVRLLSGHLLKTELARCTLVFKI